MKSAILTACSVLLLAASGVCQVRYTVIDLGRLSERTADSAAFGISDRGQVAVTVPAADGKVHAQLWDASQGLQALGSSGNAESVGRSVNYFGTVAGWTIDASGQRAAVWQDGSITFLPLNENGRAIAINDGGIVVGESGATDKTAFLFDPAVGLTTLGKLSGTTSTAATAVNGYRDVVGFATNPADVFPHKAFIWTQAGGLRLLLPKFSGTSVAFGINDSGLAVGYAMNKSSWKAFITNAVTGRTLYYELPVLDQKSTKYSVAYSINERGQAVGESNARAFVIDNGVISDLNTLIAAESGWKLSIAYDVNASGQIVGVGMLNGEAHAFMLTPLPSPDGTSTLTTRKGR